MSIGLLSLIVIALAAAGYVIGRQLALSKAGGDIRRLHSLPGYYGQTVFLFTAVPALVLMLLWLLVQPLLIETRVTSMIPAADIPDGSSANLVMTDVRRIAEGIDLILARGKLGEAEITAMRADLADVRSRLAEVGVAVGTNVKPGVFEAAKAYRAFYQKVGEGEGYTMNHGLTVYLMGPDGKFRAALAHDLGPEKSAQLIERVMKRG